MLAEFRATFEFSCIEVPVRAVSRMTSPLDSSPTSWTQFANELRSSIDPQLFEPSFCTDTQVRCAVLHFNSSKFILRDVHADWRFREGRAAANGQVSAALRSLNAVFSRRSCRHSQMRAGLKLSERSQYSWAFAAS